jgi:hypothetical protein
VGSFNAWISAYANALAGLVVIDELDVTTKSRALADRPAWLFDLAGANALAGMAVINELDPKQVLALFLDQMS